MSEFVAAVGRTPKIVFVRIRDLGWSDTRGNVSKIIISFVAIIITTEFFMLNISCKKYHMVNYNKTKQLNSSETTCEADLL